VMGEKPPRLIPPVPSPKRFFQSGSGELAERKMDQREEHGQAGRSHARP